MEIEHPHIESRSRPHEYFIRFFGDFRKISLDPDHIFPLEYSENEIKFYVKRKYNLIRSFCLLTASFGISLSVYFKAEKITAFENTIATIWFCFLALSLCLEFVAILSYREVKESIKKTLLIFIIQFIVNLWPLYCPLETADYLSVVYNFLPNLLLIQMVIMQSTYLHNSLAQEQTKLRFIVIGLTLIYIPIFILVSGILFRIQLASNQALEAYIFFIGFVICYTFFLLLNIINLSFYPIKLILAIASLSLLLVNCREHGIKISVLFVSYIIRYFCLAPIIRDVILYLIMYF